MFPGVDGFHWTFGHILFLSLFGLVGAVLGTTVLLAVRRAARDVAKGQGAHIAWHADFEDLPASDRCCRHQLSGQVALRTCDNGFDCAHCPAHLELAKAKPADLSDTFGLTYPADRLYHRGHTWVHAEEDGTYTIGLDDLAARIIGKIDALTLPRVGTDLHAPAVAWSFKKNGRGIDVRAPMSGTVVETGGAERGWYLRVKPHTTPDLRALLSAGEVPGWLASEIARLQRRLAAAGNTLCLSDGVFAEGLMDLVPDLDWEAVVGSLFLHP